MAYQKIENRSYTRFKTVLSVLVLAGLAAIAYIVWSGGFSKTTQVTVTQGEGGQIAQLSSDYRFVAGASTENTTQQTAQEPENTPLAQADYSYAMNLPTGWSMTDSITLTNPCNPATEQTIETYTNAQETLLLYVNGSPAGCNNETIGDVYFDYDFTEENNAILVNNTVVPEFCTKEQNPTCPKGDGAVTVFIGNTSNEDESFVPNPLNESTYYFKVTDTKLETDLKAQATALSQLTQYFSISQD